MIKIKLSLLVVFASNKVGEVKFDIRVCKSSKKKRENKECFWEMIKATKIYLENLKSMAVVFGGNSRSNRRGVDVLAEYVSQK